jgi:hypothetical protein
VSEEYSRIKNLLSWGWASSQLNEPSILESGSTKFASKLATKFKTLTVIVLTLTPAAIREAIATVRIPEREAQPGENAIFFTGL